MNYPNKNLNIIYTFLAEQTKGKLNMQEKRRSVCFCAKIVLTARCSVLPPGQPTINNRST